MQNMYEQVLKSSDVSTPNERNKAKTASQNLVGAMSSAKGNAKRANSLDNLNQAEQNAEMPRTTWRSSQSVSADLENRATNLVNNGTFLARNSVILPHSILANATNISR